MRQNAGRMWRELAENQTFWSTVAAASTVLLIAVVLEGRTGRELLDQQSREANTARQEALSAHEQEWTDWQAKWKLHEENGGPDPGPPPSLVKPVPPEDPAGLKRVLATGNRLAALLLALWALAGAIVGSLVLVSPAEYPGDLAAGTGIVVTLVLVAGGVGALLYATTARITRG